MNATALRLDVADRLAVITFDQPGSKANTLGLAVLGEFEQVVGQLDKMSGLDGVVLQSGKPGMFIAGADLRELATVRDEATSRMLVKRGLDMIGRLEQLPCPTVALVDGACMGGGLEVALAFDYRLAGSNPKTELGLPEVKVGLIPGWGGTQRLTRLIGPSQAAELICAGEAVNPRRARELGLVFDAVPSDKLLDEAKRLIAWSRQSGDWREARRRKQQPVGLSEDQLAFTYGVARAQVLAKTKGQFPAPIAALDAIVMGCNLPLDDALKAESDLFVPLVGSLISRNLIAVFFMNQRLAKDTGVADATLQPKQLQRVGVIGAGIMGAGIAGAHIRRGAPALMLDVAQPALDKGVAAIHKSLQGRVEIGRMTPAELLKALSLLNTTQNLGMLSDRDLVIEAVVENEAVKTKLYRDLHAIVADDAILASNTSTISITRMAQAWKNPAQFAGLHFFNPVDRMQLVEVIRGEQTSDQTVVTLVAHAKRVGKSPIVVRDCPGFLVNRILFPYMNEAYALLEEGASPRDLDRAATEFGMPMGPITLSDVVGLDTALYAGMVVNTAFAGRSKSTRIVGELVKAGRLGQKSGAGFYSYAKGSRGIDDPALAGFLEKCRSGQRGFTEEELTDRMFLPMLVEASLVLMENIVRDPADVDLGLILGIGFPAFRGGLLRWADSEGLDTILQRLAKYEPLGKRFAATPQMKQLAQAGKGFYPSS
ncbi:MAG: 3-hydroxyacyl-CoA dehydrogenase NAD-binding domain-containing protein [Gemmataceae bacterium]|nr:3-hydroxyacyl-CoA dehydrogenase NAD-binding domain-containing protein [Gemmataceae bacterium]